jgi:hypothetical protein
MLETSLCGILSQYPVPIAPKISVLFYMTQVEIIHVSHEHHDTSYIYPPIQSIIFWHALQSLYPVSYFYKNKCDLHEIINRFHMCLMNSLTHSAQIRYWKLTSWLPLDHVIKMCIAVRVSIVHMRLWTAWRIVLTCDTRDLLLYIPSIGPIQVHSAPNIRAVYRRQ